MPKTTVHGGSTNRFEPGYYDTPDTAAEENADASEGRSGTDYQDWSLKELQDELKSRDLPFRGNKPELVQRLTAADEEKGV